MDGRTHRLSLALFSDGRQTCYVRALGGTLDITIRVGGGSWTKSDHYTKTEMINTIGNINYDANYGEFDASGWDRINSNVTVEVEGADGQKYGLPFPRTGEIPYATLLKIQIGLQHPTNNNHTSIPDACGIGDFFPKSFVVSEILCNFVAKKRKSV